MRSLYVILAVWLVGYCTGTANTEGTRVKSAELSAKLYAKRGYVFYGGIDREASLSLQTHDEAIELTSLTCDLMADTKVFTCVTRIESPSLILSFTNSARSSMVWDWDKHIPISTKDRSVVLTPHTNYTITVSCSGQFNLIELPWPRYTEPHFDIQLPRDVNDKSKYSSFARAIYYKTVS